MENKLGKELATLKTPLPKVILNLVLVGLGIFAGLAMSLSGLAVCGVPIMLGCLALAGLVFFRQFGRAVTFYENGLVVKNKGNVSEYTLDDVTDVRINAAQRGRYNRSVRLLGYTFYSDEKEIVSLGLVFPEWEYYGRELSNKVIASQTHKLLNKFNHGEPLVFSHLRKVGLIRDTELTLTVSSQGVQLGNNVLLDWSQIQSIRVRNANSYSATVDIIDKTNTRYWFSYFRSRGAVIASNVLANIMTARAKT